LEDFGSYGNGIASVGQLRLRSRHTQRAEGLTGWKTIADSDSLGTMNHFPLLLALILIALATTTRAQFAPDSPEAAATAYYEAFRSGELDEVTALMHPEALAAFRAMVMPAAEQVLGDGSDALDPEATQLLLSLAGEDSLATLRVESDSAFFTRFMRWILRVHPAMADTLAGAVITPLGSVPEGTQAHVVYRMKLSLLGLNANRVDVLTLKRDEKGDWKLLLTGDLEGLGQLFQPVP
jgi:hypothetical protein